MSDREGQQDVTNYNTMSIGVFRGEYEIAPISSREATDFLVPRHYLHRAGPCSLAFGMFTSSGDMVGCVTYGTPSSAPLRRGLAGPEHADDVAELTRLWVDDTVPRNGESFLIGNTIRHNSKRFIVSFADIEAGHLGTIYQATNFLYTGLSAKRTDWKVEGIDVHGQTLADKYTAEEIRAKFGDRFRLEPRSRKHRYVFINALKRERRQLIADLRYPVLPYPKQEALR